jgi:hypothetical protein
MATKHCFRCGRFMGEACRYCTDPIYSMAFSLYSMALITTLISSPDIPGIIGAVNRQVLKYSSG